jgi:transposase-like protein
MDQTRHESSLTGTLVDVSCSKRDSIAELCRCVGISESLCYSWSKEFMEAGKA